MPDYEVGYKKPPVETRFGQPNGNKPGLTSEAAYALHEANEKSAKLYLEMVTAVEAKIEAMKKDDPDSASYAALVAVKGDVLRLLKDIMDRTIGTPKSSVDLSSEDGSMSAPTRIELVAVAPKRAQDGG